jgi:Ca-activated chloride channel family protein
VNDQFLESLANNGDGFYAYIDSVKEAIKVFVENSTDTLQVIAKDAKIQVYFNPKTVKYYRLIGYEDKLLASTDFRNDKVDAGEIGPNHSVTALYEIFLNEENTKKAEGNERIADLTLRFKDVDLQNTPLEVTKEVSLKDLSANFDKSSSSLKLALAVALYGEILRGSYWKANNSFQDILKLINELDETSKNDEKVLEFKNIVEKAIEIYK